METDSTGFDYTLRDDDEWDRMMQRRTALKEAAFVLPFLERGMSLVDIGCGQGTITLDLAELVAPGIVKGFDPQDEHIARARTLARERGLATDFEVGDIYDPPFEKASFDVCFAHMVFMHLPDPATALKKSSRSGQARRPDRNSGPRLELPLRGRQHERTEPGARHRGRNHECCLRQLLRDGGG